MSAGDRAARADGRRLPGSTGRFLLMPRLELPDRPAANQHRRRGPIAAMGSRAARRLPAHLRLAARNSSSESIGSWSPASAFTSVADVARVEVVLDGPTEPRTPRTSVLRAGRVRIEPSRVPAPRDLGVSGAGGVVAKRLLIAAASSGTGTTGCLFVAPFRYPNGTSPTCSPQLELLSLRLRDVHADLSGPVQSRAPGHVPNMHPAFGRAVVNVAARVDERMPYRFKAVEDRVPSFFVARVPAQFVNQQHPRSTDRSSRSGGLNSLAPAFETLLVKADSPAPVYSMHRLNSSRAHTAHASHGAAHEAKGGPQRLALVADPHRAVPPSAAASVWPVSNCLRHDLTSSSCKQRRRSDAAGSGSHTHCISSRSVSTRSSDL